MTTPLDALVENLVSSFKAHRFLYVIIQSSSFIDGLIRQLGLSTEKIPQEFWATNLLNERPNKLQVDQAVSSDLRTLFSVPYCTDILILRAQAFICENKFEAAKVILDQIQINDPKNNHVNQILKNLETFNALKFKIIDDNFCVSTGNPTSLRIWKLANAIACDRKGPVVTEDDFFVADGSPVDLHSCLQTVVIRKNQSSQKIDNLIPLNTGSANNFWHWCIEQLPRAYTACLSGINAKILVQQKSDFVVQTLAALGIAAEQIIESKHQVDLETKNLYFVEHPDLSDKHRQIYQNIKDAVVRYCNSKSSRETLRPKRIYVQRKGARVVINEPALLDLLGKFGFTPVCFDYMAFVDQVAITSNTQIFLGPHGASFAHNLFMPDESCVIEMFSPNYVNPCMTHIHKFFNQKYHMVVAKNRSRVYQYEDDVDVPLDILEVILKSIT